MVHDPYLIFTESWDAGFACSLITDVDYPIRLAFNCLNAASQLSADSDKLSME